jgi:hypothetical protein
MNRIQPSFRDFFTNIKAPLPWPAKVHLLFRNNWLKIRNLSNCWGNLGEPGCRQRDGGPCEGGDAENPRK